MFKLITPSQIGANKYQNIIFEILRLSLLCITVPWDYEAAQSWTLSKSRIYIPHFQVWCSPHKFLFLLDSYKIYWLRSFWLQHDISRLILRHFQSPPLSVCKHNVLLVENQLKEESKQQLLPNTDCYCKERELNL